MLSSRFSTGTSPSAQMDVEPARAVHCAGQGGQQKVPQHIFPLNHGHGPGEKLGQDDKVHRQVVRLGGQHLVGHVLVEEQQVPPAQGDGLPASGMVDDVAGGTGALVHHLHIVVPVAGERGEAGVGADLNEPPLFQQLAAVHHKLPAEGIQIPADAVSAGQNSLLLRGDFPQVIQQLLAQGAAPLTLIGSVYHCTGMDCK